MLPRTVLLDILYHKLDLDTCEIKTNSQLTTYVLSEEGPVTLYFDNGTTSEADLLIGADGVHSRVRAVMFKEDTKYAVPQFSGQFAYRMKCLQEDLRKMDPNHQALTGFKIVS